VTDNRVNKTCQVLMESGYEVVLIGRELPGSMALPHWPFKAIRMKLFFIKGPAFYFFFNLRLFFKLWSAKADLLFANDLDTLWPNYLVSKWKKIPLVYDSHELFCDVPELLHSPFKRKIWQRLERRIVPKLKTCITVNHSIARIFEEKYKTKFNVIRNIPAPVEVKPLTKKELNLPEDKKIIMLQGAGINIDRGAEELVDAMQYVENTLLLIIGGGDVWPLLEERARRNNLEGKVRLIKKIPKAELINYTLHADLGISIDKNTNPNYYNSLPNKIFDYLQAGVPILATRLPEIERIISYYQVGIFIDSHDPKHIAETINRLFSSALLNEFKNNTSIAAKELNWSSEKQKYLEILNQVSH
jgi:glycosyltransferase involved in cell wall biosynthesis